jgi:hypothetical protein|tara:strand:- start:1820 stop:2305 length:486 start_codon:yes stop_codon:yes gene_type:complete
MDYNKFEDRISRWIENDMDVKERKEFEKFLSDHPEYQSKVEEVRNTISVMNQAPILKVSSDFDANLNQRLKTLGLNENIKKSIFGFSNQNFAYLTLTLGAIFVLTSFLIQSNSTYMFADKELDSKEILIPSDSLEIKDEMDEMKDVDLLNNIDGSFVNDEQ